MRYPVPLDALTPFAPVWWKNAIQIWEIALAAPFVAATRTARLAAAGPVPNARDRKEFIGMGLEKWQAFGESMTAMAAELWRLNLELAARGTGQWLSAWAALASLPFSTRMPGNIVQAQAAVARHVAAAAGSKRIADAMSRVARKGLAPIHKRATGNAKRLRRLKKR